MTPGRRQPSVPKGLRRGLAAPCFADDPADLVQLGIGAERAGFDGYFLWDHLVHSDSGEGPSIVDPWQVLAVVAAPARLVPRAVRPARLVHYRRPPRRAALGCRLPLRPVLHLI